MTSDHLFDPIFADNRRATEGLIVHKGLKGRTNLWAIIFIWSKTTKTWNLKTLKLNSGVFSPLSSSGGLMMSLDEGEKKKIQSLWKRWKLDLRELTYQIQTSPRLTGGNRQWEKPQNSTVNKTKGEVLPASTNLSSIAIKSSSAGKK